VDDRERLELYIDLTTHPGWIALMEEMEEAVKIRRYSAIERPVDIMTTRAEVKAMEQLMVLRERSIAELESLEEEDETV
jgi:hypothetical protein